MDSNDVQTAIVNEEGLITGDDNSDELMQTQMVYASQVFIIHTGDQKTCNNSHFQSETDAGEADMTNELELDEYEENEDFSSEPKEQQSTRV